MMSTRIWAWMSLVNWLMGASPATASQLQAVVVLRVVDQVSVPAADMEEANAAVVRVYERAQVRIVCVSDRAPAPAANEVHTVEMVLGTHEKLAQNLGAGILGTAVPSVNRAYVFYDRVVAYARRTESPVSRVLAVVMAHEVAHLLLRDDRHSPSGIMRARWSGSIVRLPGFTEEQAARLRHVLTVPAPAGSIARLD